MERFVEFVEALEVLRRPRPRPGPSGSAAIVPRFRRVQAAAARRSTAISSAFRMKWLLRTALSLIGATRLPFCGKTSINSSSTSRVIALRTGVRETPIWRQMRFSLIDRSRRQPQRDDRLLQRLVDLVADLAAPIEMDGQPQEGVVFVLGFDRQSRRHRPRSKIGDSPTKAVAGSQLVY